MGSSVLLGVISCIFVAYTDAACTIPDVFQSTTWVDNVKGDIVFSTWVMSGWDVLVGSMNLSNWEIVDNVKFEEEGTLALRAVDSVDLPIVTAGVTTTKTYYSFMCLKFEKVNDIIYKYYIMHDPETRANNEKVILSETDHLTRLDDICLPGYTPPPGEFGVWVKKDEKPITICPDPVLARFTYTVHMPDDTTRCTNASIWEGCRDNRRMTFNLTKCSFPMMYSGEGDLTCVASVHVAGITYLIVHNGDETVDDEFTFRFSCIVITDNGLSVSIAPRGCQPDQTPGEIPTDRFTNDIGYRIVNKQISQCRIGQPGDGDGDGLSTPEIVGIGVGAAVLVVIVIVIICVCIKRR